MAMAFVLRDFFRILEKLEKNPRVFIFEVLVKNMEKYEGETPQGGVFTC
ncbi:hypothetical protein [Bartonella doshiae]|uniref:Uncharacterized protein n=2 Tax=Bartonella doshiae TaxID=33044 RepID=A0A380ZFB0_BARDO|nr:hypothetical protein [Bartonella doshiae]EJF80026.1 hypothetical protein MCS_01221 [Bartonella doshiae NCTC 12862 = ATCC 700133]MBB6158881.1 hypothetical protein [Bartonella doshiae]SUV45637.1 Uncharacterised protein [Bartonella doshiae]